MITDPPFYQLAFSFLVFICFGRRFCNIGQVVGIAALQTCFIPAVHIVVDKYFSVPAMGASTDFYLSHVDLLFSSFLNPEACPLKMAISYLTTR